MTGEFGIAIHALVVLNHKRAIVTSEKLAENICTHPARVRSIMAKLRKHGLVETREGVEGGYHFIKNPETVTLKEVGDAVGARFVHASWRSGGADQKCMIASGMAGVMDDIYDELDALCRERLAACTIADIGRRIFVPSAVGKSHLVR